MNDIHDHGTPPRPCCSRSPCCWPPAVAPRGRWPAGGIGSGTDGKGSLTLNVGDQKGGSEAVLRAAGELDDLTYKIKWSTFTSGPPLLEAVNAGAVDIGGVGNTPPVFAAAAKSKIKVIAGSHSRADGDAVLVKKDSPLKRPPS